MDTELLAYIAGENASGRIGVLCTIIESRGSAPREAGTSMWVSGDAVRGTVGGGISEHEVIKKAREMLKDGTQTALVQKRLTAEEGLACGGSIQVYLERIGNDPELFIFGGGHVGRSLAAIAPSAGFRVTVWDDRADCITPELFPHAHRICCPLSELFAGDTLPFRFHQNVYCVAVTRGHRCDADVLRYLYGKPLAYIGMIGSVEKNTAVTALLAQEGLAAEYLDSIYKPIGLPIRAETPGEIAVSITAELIAVRRNGNPALLRQGYTASRHG
ncbi:MAG: XdhC family protein [Treponema sp.]